MTEHAQKHQQTARQEDEQETQAAEDLRNEQLDEDVACCLTEIDKLLEAEAESERDKAIREFRELMNADDYRKEMRLWRAQYAHLGLRIAEGCCSMALIDDNATSGSGVIERW